MNSKELALHYFDLSNAGKLDEIRKLMTDSTTYSSANTGVYLGVDDIIKMQTEFFAKFENLSWEIHKVETPKPDIIVFDFTFNGRTLDGEKIVRPGIETIVGYQGKIQHVEVRSKT